MAVNPKPVSDPLPVLGLDIPIYALFCSQDVYKYSYPPGPGPSEKRSPVPKDGEEVILCEYHECFSLEPGIRYGYSLLVSTDHDSRIPFFRQSCVYVPELSEIHMMSNVVVPGTLTPVPYIVKVMVRESGPLGLCGVL
ncbi:hypothetical protein F4811DRAFT_552277 [Daldinia bambusicola]|nr:hypothetical protein F4811DRAFT_552277 [Daldinia bambusicola]